MTTLKNKATELIKLFDGDKKLAIELHTNRLKMLEFQLNEHKNRIEKRIFYNIGAESVATNNKELKELFNNFETEIINTLERQINELKELINLIDSL